MPPLIESGDACAELLNSYLPPKTGEIRIKATPAMEDKLNELATLEKQKRCLRTSLMK